MALFNRNFTLLWQGQLVSQLGSQAFLIATAYFTLEATGSATLVAAVMAASTLPIAILAPVGGTFADRHSRRAILVVTDFSRALAVGGLGLFLIWRPEVTPGHIALIVAVAAFSGMMGALFSPAIQALIPDLVPAERLAAANSVGQISRQTSILIGQAIGGALYVSWGVEGLLLFDAASFAYGGLATWFIAADRQPRQAGMSVRETMKQYALDTREGLSYVWQRNGMSAVLAIFAGVNFLFMPVFVLLPFYVGQVLGRGPEWYGFLLAGSGAGALAGSAAAAILLSRVRAGASLIRMCVAGVACCVLLLAATRGSWLALAAFIFIGALSSVINVVVITTFQSAVPSDVRGRVMALVIALSTAAVPIGMGAGGVMGDLWRDSLPLVFGGCGAAIAILIGVSSQVPGFGDLLDLPVRAEPRTGGADRT
jgi:MFS transporter, DHA3 family, macrolide efflux protein